MPTYTTHFQQVHAYRSLVGECPNCGKKTKKSRKFTMTVNPYNVNEDGEVRSVSEVREQVNAEADAWVPDFSHINPCTPN